MAFLGELKRRRVGKVAIAYGAIAWAVTEASSVVFPALHLPEWTITFVVVFLLVGFPISMVLAWIFDVGPEGIERTEPLRDTPVSDRLKLRVAYAVAVLLCMALLGYVLYERGLGRAHAVQPRDSIAVLPFTNMSGDPARDYFSDGMSEELLNLLARVPGLQVASRTSSFAYKGRNLDIRQVGRELGVQTVLEGSVRQAGDTVRITAQLVDTETGFHLWSETYDRQLADIFEVQDEIAQAIVQELRLELAPEQQQVAQRDKAPTQNVEAYEFYLQGRAVWKRRGEENIRRAIELYQAALGRDPAFARAHAALASAYVVLPGYIKDKQSKDTEQYFRLAETSARQGLAIDPNLGEAHAVLAEINAERGDLLDAEAGFFFAVSLEPNEATPHHWYSILLSRVGRLDAALAQARLAQELDPSSPIIAANLANVYFVKGNDEQALRYTRLAGELGLSTKSTGVEAAIAMRRGEWEKAEQLLLAQQHLPAEIKTEIPGWLAAVRDPALRPAMVEGMRALDPNVAEQIQMVDSYLQLDQVDLVFEVLFQALDRNPEAWIQQFDLNLAWSPEGAAMRRDPRFAELADRIGVLVDYWKQYGYPDGCRAGSETSIQCS